MSQVSNIGNGWKWPKFFPPPISKFSSIHNQSSPAESLKTTTTWDDVRLIDMTHDKRKLFPAYSFTMDSLRGVSHPGLETLIRSMWYRWYVRTCRRFFQNQQIPPESIPTSGLTLRFQYVFTLAFWGKSSAPAARSHGKSGSGFHETKGSVPSSGPDTAVIFIHTLLSPWRPCLVASIIFQQFVGNSRWKLSGWMALCRGLSLG